MQEVRKIKNFTDLTAWVEAHKLVLKVYSLTKGFPKDEQFGLVNQLRRAVVSVTSNIAEGFSRSSYKEKAQFYSMSLGSLTEVQNQIIIARDLDYLASDDYASINELTILESKLLNGLIKSSRSHDS
ncbi:MAG: four helix bundle protein [Candidatus Levyibacteriota bacterium]